MGKIIEYKVTLYPAKCERGYVVTSFEIGSDIEYPGLRFEADSVKAMLARVRPLSPHMASLVGRLSVVWPPVNRPVLIRPLKIFISTLLRLRPHRLYFQSHQ